MSQNDSFFKKLFDPSGRSGRCELLLLALVSGLLSLILIGIYTGIVAYIRRCHDLGKSGWFILLLLIPFVGFFIALYLWFAPGVKQGGAEKPA